MGCWTQQKPYGRATGNALGRENQRLGRTATSRRGSSPTSRNVGSLAMGGTVDPVASTTLAEEQSAS
eukprot:2416975-Amphidinium_carterae.1